MKQYFFIMTYGIVKRIKDLTCFMFRYLAPEYASSGKLTDRSDVFSFGVVLLELVTGRKPVDQNQPLGEESLVEWVKKNILQLQ